MRRIAKGISASFAIAGVLAAVTSPLTFVASGTIPEISEFDSATIEKASMLQFMGGNVVFFLGIAAIAASMPKEE